VHHWLQTLLLPLSDHGYIIAQLRACENINYHNKSMMVSTNVDKLSTYTLSMFWAIVLQKRQVNTLFLFAAQSSVFPEFLAEIFFII